MALLMQLPADVRSSRVRRWRKFAHETAIQADDAVAHGRIYKRNNSSFDSSETRFSGSLRDYVRVTIFARCSYSLASRIPEEIIAKIEHYALQPGSRGQSSLQGPQPMVADPRIPPERGASPFLALPVEIRVLIYKHTVQLNSTIAKPCCESKSAPKVRSAIEQRSTARQLRNMMILNSKICKELQRVIYEGRRFAIHVHSGYIGGGVEFVDTGRQPLQFHVGKCDERFKRFALNDDFGFSSLAQIDVHIFPVRSTERKDRLHGVLAANAMNTALVNLIMQRIEKGGKVNSLRLIIETPGEDNEFSLDGTYNFEEAADPWWNTQTQEPLWTCFHNLSDVQLAVQPFMKLHNIRDVKITIPHTLASHGPTREFCESLKSRMQSIVPMASEDDELAAKIECAHLAMENRGDRNSDVPPLMEEDFSADEVNEDVFVESDCEA